MILETQKVGKIMTIYILFQKKKTYISKRKRLHNWKIGHPKPFPHKNFGLKFKVSG